MNRVTLSIIIVSWNAKDYLLQCLRSIEQTQGELAPQVIVVDNDSSDGSPEAVEREHPDVRVIRSGGNLGFSRANNLGIKAAQGDFVALINSDIVVLENCFQALIAAMRQQSAIGLAGPRVLNPDRTLQPSCRRAPGYWNYLMETCGLHNCLPQSKLFAGTFMKYWPHDDQRAVDVLSGCFWLARREALEQVGGLDENFFMYGEDMDWCKRFGNAGWGVEFCPAAQAIHFGGRSSANSPTRFFVEMQKANVQYWAKHHGGLGRAYCLSLIFAHQLLRIVSRSLIHFFVRSNRETNRYKIERSVATLRWMLHLR